jgi:hypothetical protein
VQIGFSFNNHKAVIILPFGNERVNPEIDWEKKSLRARASDVGASFHQCVRADSARRAGRARVQGARITSQQALTRSHEDALLYYAKHPHASMHGATKVMSQRELRKLKASDGEYCFFVSATTEKAARQLTSDWEALHGHPAEALLHKFKDTVFLKELPATPPTRTVDVEAEIELTDTTPVVRKQFRLSDEQKRVIREWTQEMLAAGMIRPSKSAFSSPTFSIKKAVGWRIVHDFRAVNARVRISATPVPRKEDIYDAMSKGRMFSALDLLWGFFQVRLREQDIPYTAFSTPDGLFEYLMTPMGLSSSPSAFNRLMQSVFHDQRDFCRAYFDDLTSEFPANQVDDQQPIGSGCCPIADRITATQRPSSRLFSQSASCIMPPPDGGGDATPNGNGGPELAALHDAGSAPEIHLSAPAVDAADDDAADDVPFETVRSKKAKKQARKAAETAPQAPSTTNTVTAAQTATPTPTNQQQPRRWAAAPSARGRGAGGPKLTATDKRILQLGDCVRKNIALGTIIELFAIIQRALRTAAIEESCAFTRTFDWADQAQAE